MLASPQLTAASTVLAERLTLMKRPRDLFGRCHEALGSVDSHELPRIFGRSKQEPVENVLENVCQSLQFRFAGLAVACS